MTRLLAISTLLALALFTGCPGGGDSAEGTADASPSASEPAASPETETPPKPEATAAPESNLSPDAVKADEPVDAAELKNAVQADQEAWKGKEVTVRGENDGQSVSQLKTGQSVIISVRPTGGGDTVVDCRGTEKPPEGSLSATLFKGTVKEFNYGKVTLEPCGVSQ